MKENFDEKQSLQIIYETIENAKANFRDDGFFYLLWGWLVFVASLLQYFLLNFTDFMHHYIGWPVLMTAGFIISLIYGIRLGKKMVVRTHFVNIILFVWYGFLIPILVVLLMTFLGKMSFGVSNPLIIMLFSYATFISGGVLRFRPLIIGALISWAIGILSFFLEKDTQLLMTALAIISAYLVPGYMLKYRK